MRKQNRHGFTLIELIASAVLATMLTAALVSIVWSATQETRLLRIQRARWQPTTQLESQLRRDLQNARGMALTVDGLQLHGFLDQDPRSGQTTQLPGTISYRHIVKNGHGLLVRSVSGPSGTMRTPVWYGCGGIRVEPLQETDPEDALLMQPVTGGLPPVPGSLRITLLDDSGEILWREVVFHHAS